MVPIAGSQESWIAYSEQALIFGWSVCLSGTKHYADANTGEAALKHQQKPPKSLTPSKLSTPTGNSLRLVLCPESKVHPISGTLAASAPKENNTTVCSQNI